MGGLIMNACEVISKHPYLLSIKAKNPDQSNCKNCSLCSLMLLELIICWNSILALQISIWWGNKSEKQNVYAQLYMQRRLCLIRAERLQDVNIVIKALILIAGS